MPKFFIEAGSLIGTHIEIHGGAAHHIVNVLRHEIGDNIILCDGNSTDYVTTLISCEKGSKNALAKFEVLEAKKSITEPPIFIRLYQSVIKWDSFDIAIQKSVEVGASQIVPIVTERSIYKIIDVRKKTERFGRIAKSAAEQSKRGIVPMVTEPICIDDAIQNKGKVAFFACCDEEKTLANRLDQLKIKKVDLWIGPEGGFTDSEKKSLLAKGIVPFTLGPRVLRSETASIVSIANLLALYQR